MTHMKYRTMVIEILSTSLYHHLKMNCICIPNVRCTDQTVIWYHVRNGFMTCLSSNQHLPARYQFKYKFTCSNYFWFKRKISSVLVIKLSKIDLLNQTPGFQTLYIVTFFHMQWFEVRGDCSFCWYWWIVDQHSLNLFFCNYIQSGFTSLFNFCSHYKLF